MKDASHVFKKIPLLKQWILDLLKENEKRAQSLENFRFLRLYSYCSPRLLQSVRVVVVETLPLPPLASWGVTEFKPFEREPFLAITYADTIFLLKSELMNEAVVFHELVHVLQWKLLGEDLFLRLYVEGLLEEMYFTCPLEVMAYKAQEEFEDNSAVYDLEKRVKEEIKALEKNNRDAT
ncbi:MAG: hypothetical protein U1F57_08135 [bacterium]